jgi:hypothetical protein
MAPGKSRPKGGNYRLKSRKSGSPTGNWLDSIHGKTDSAQQLARFGKASTTKELRRIKAIRSRTGENFRERFRRSVSHDANACQALFSAAQGTDCPHPRGFPRLACRLPVGTPQCLYLQPATELLRIREKATFLPHPLLKPPERRFAWAAFHKLARPERQRVAVRAMEGIRRPRFPAGMRTRTL